MVRRRKRRSDRDDRRRRWRCQGCGMGSWVFWEMSVGRSLMPSVGFRVKNGRQYGGCQYETTQALYEVKYSPRMTCSQDNMSRVKRSCLCYTRVVLLRHLHRPLAGFIIPSTARQCGIRPDVQFENLAIALEPLSQLVFRREYWPMRRKRNIWHCVVPDRIMKD